MKTLTFYGKKKNPYPEKRVKQVSFTEEVEKRLKKLYEEQDAEHSVSALINKIVYDWFMIRENK